MGAPGISAQNHSGRRARADHCRVKGNARQPGPSRPAAWHYSLDPAQARREIQYPSGTGYKMKEPPGRAALGKLRAKDSSINWFGPIVRLAAVPRAFLDFG